MNGNQAGLSVASDSGNYFNKYISYVIDNV